MEELLAFGLIAIFVLGFGLFSKPIQLSVLTPPMVFTVLGLLLGSQLLGLVHMDVEGEFLNILAELTLVLVLFTDASRIDLRRLRLDHNLPVRLLAIGLPLTIIFGGLVAMLIFEVLTFWEAVVLAVILAPTDAALGQAVVSSPKVPTRIRQTLNVESGLNDGIALPILLFFISVAGVEEQTRPVQEWLRFGALQIILGPLVGGIVGYVGGKLVDWSENQAWMVESFQRLVALALALLAFALAELVGGNGFIAAFCAGMFLGNFFKGVTQRLYEFAETETQLLTLLTFILFGAVLLPPAFQIFSWNMVLYALLSLTVIRIIPVMVSLIGLRLQLQTLIFLGWFGPRGIASILYCLLVLEEANLRGRDPMYAIIMITVLISIFAHGLTAVPGANWYGAHAEAMQDEPDLPEWAAVSEMPVRWGYNVEN